MPIRPARKSLRQACDFAVQEELTEELPLDTKLS